MRRTTVSMSAKTVTISEIQYPHQPVLFVKGLNESFYLPIRSRVVGSTPGMFIYQHTSFKFLGCELRAIVRHQLPREPILSKQRSQHSQCFVSGGTFHGGHLKPFIHHYQIHVPQEGASKVYMDSLPWLSRPGPWLKGSGRWLFAITLAYIAFIYSLL